MYERYEKLLQERGLNSYKVAKATGINNQTFSAWKNGIYTPKREKMQKIADFLGVSVDYLIGTTDKPTDDITAYEIQERFNASKERLNELNEELEHTIQECNKVKAELEKYRYLFSIVNKIEKLSPEQRATIEALLDHLNK